MGTRQIATPAHASLPGLALHATAARAEALLKERERLLRAVNKKKQLVERAREKSSLEAQTSVAKMAPLVERHGVLVRELTALFDELLVEGWLSARARTQVRKLRSSLERQGYCVARGQARPSRLRGRWRAHASPPQSVGACATFSRLARAVDPDRARQESEERTPHEGDEGGHARL